MNESLIDPKQASKVLKPNDEVILANIDDDQSQDDEIDLRQLLSTLNHYKWWILSIFITAIIIALLFFCKLEASKPVL